MKILPFIVAAVLFPADASPQATNSAPDGEVAGRALAKTFLERHPAENLTNTAVLEIRDWQGDLLQFPFTCEVIAKPPAESSPGFWQDSQIEWETCYKVLPKTNLADAETLVIDFKKNQPNAYRHHIPTRDPNDPAGRGPEGKSGGGIMTPFANSDFWLADLGLEFFHWPAQTFLKKELRRGRHCDVLQSANPDPPANGYSRVVTWMDEESGGIVHAEAFDANGRLLKVFDPKSFKKVNGRWELRDMEIRNVQTGSRSRIEFDLKPD
jgi:hypothetical protein